MVIFRVVMNCKDNKVSKGKAKLKGDYTKYTNFKKIPWLLQQMDMEYVDIRQGNFDSQFRLLI